MKKKKKTATKVQIQILYDSTSLRNRVLKSLETESIMVVIWGLREGNGEFLFHEHRDYTLEDEKKFQSWVVTKVAPKCECT